VCERERTLVCFCVSREGENMNACVYHTAIYNHTGARENISVCKREYRKRERENISVCVCIERERVRI
jgi:hypothetical protein